MSAWTPEQDQVLREKSATMSYSAIAVELGKSRNSCISRANRIGLKKVDLPRAPYAGNIVKKARAAKKPPRIAPPKAVKVAKPAPVPPPAAENVAEPYGQDLAVLKRWPRPKTATAVPYLDAMRGKHCLMPLFETDTPLEERFVCGAPPTETHPSWCAVCAKA